MYVHVVTFSFHDPAVATEAKARLLAMEGRVETLRAIEVGIDEGKTPRSVHMALITRFDDLAGYQAYAVHPVHKEVLAYMGDKLSGVSVVDWTA